MQNDDPIQNDGELNPDDIDAALEDEDEADHEDGTVSAEKLAEQEDEEEEMDDDEEDEFDMLGDEEEESY